jgi:hypothetical protein
MRRVYYRTQRRRVTNCENLIPLGRYAAAAHLSASTVRQRILDGQLEAYKRAGKWFVRRETT